MKSRKTLFTLVLLAVLLVFGLAQTQPAQAQGTTLYVTPFTPSRGNTCEPTTMYVRVGSVTNLTAYHLELTYDPAQIEIISIENGGFLNATDAFLEPTNTFGADTGRIKWGMAQRGTNGDPNPKSGTGALIKITFQPLAAGVTTTITLDGDNSTLVDWPDAFAIPFTVPTDKGAASYSLTGEVVSNVSATPAVNYCSLATATSAAASGDELRFLTNFEEFGAAFVNNKALTIDTNGFTATRTTTSEFGYLVTVGTGGSVTLTGDGALITQTYGAPLNLSNGAVAVVNGPTLTGGFRSVRVNGDTSASTWNPTYSTFTLQSGNLTNGVIVLGNGATAIINGGTISRPDGQGAITGNGTVNTSYNYGGTSVTVNGGTINAGTTAAIYQPQSGTLTINGGTINGITSAIEMKRGVLTVTGGTITGATDGILIDNPAGGYVVNGAMSVDISGGVITGTNGYAVHEQVPSDASLRTTSVEISGGDFTGGTEGVIFSDQLLAAASANPPTAVLALTDGRYSHDPDRFVFAPYGSYLESPWWLIDQLVGTIERDPGNTGDIPNWTPLTVTVIGDTIDFLGEIAWYPADETLGRTEGHRVGVEINAPAGYPTADTTFTFNGNTYNWNTVADGDNFVWIYPKVTAVPQNWEVVVTWKEGVTQTFTINVLTGSKLEPTISAGDFAYLNDPADAHGTFLGVNSSWTTNGGFIDDVASIVVELFGEDENGDEVLLQTNTSKLDQFTDISEFSSPFNIYGKYNYATSAWTNVRQTEFGQHLPATRVKATMTLNDGRIYTAENTLITGNRADIVPTLNAQDFGYMASSGVKGVSAGFGTTKVTLDQAVSIKVELFTGPSTAYQLLQTNTAIAGTDLFSAITNFSSPFDIFGTFDYPTDGYWVNARQAEYGQKAIPTRVLATVELPGGFIMTAENTTLTGDRRTIVSTLDEEIAEAPNYVYDPVYEYSGDMTFDDTSNTYTMKYWPAEYLDGAPMRDLARYLGALHYQDISTVESITYDGVVYTWDVNGTLVGSNWKDENDVTLVSVVVADLINQIPATATMTISDGLNTANVTFVVDVYNTLDDEIESAPTYVYDPVYNYVGTFAFVDATNTYTATYTDINYNPGALYDLARYLGALHRQDGATVIKITYKGVDYTWDPQGTLHGSNWEDANGTTLVSVVGADFQNGTIVPGTGFTFTVADGLHTETVTFILIIEDTTPPTIGSIVAAGAAGFDDVTAVGTTLTVDHGYTVDHITVTLDEAVVVADGTVVSQAGVPYGTITANGTVLTIVPYPGNEVASIKGTFVFSVPAGSITDLAGNALATNTVTLVVNNLAPLAADDGYTTAEDTALSITAPGVLANDTDLDDLTAVLVAGPTNGTLTLNADGSFVYTPNANWHGTDSFTYKANDGTVDSNVATVTITITAVNDAPVAQDIEVATPENTPIDIILLGSDVDGDTLTYEIVSQPANGTLTIAGKVVTYSPNANWHGSDSFTYKVNDGTVDSNVATVTIIVTPINFAPVAQDINVTTPEDTPIDITLLGTDVDGDTLTYAIVDQPTNGALTIVGDVVTYTPNANWHGMDTFTYKANDGTLDSNIATVTITVTAFNDAPVAQNVDATTPEDTAVDVTLLGTDVDGDTLTYTIVSQPAHGTLSIVGNVVTYTPNANWHGSDSFTYKVNDGTVDSNVATVTITVTPVNDAPVAQDINVTTPEDTALDIKLLGTDIDGDMLTYLIVTDPAHGTVTIVDDIATYTPSANYNGTDSFTYKANDGTADSNTATVTITITPVKDQVIAVDDSYNVDQGQTLTIAVPGVYSNDINPDNDQWVVSLKTNVEHGNLALNQDGSFVYTPDPAFRGTDSFIYTLATYPATQSLWADDAKVTITVNPVYPLPTISSNDIEGPYTVGQLREFNVTLTNPADGATYSSLSASVFVDNITFDDFETVEVKHPVYGNWVPLSPVVEGSGLRLTLGPTGNFPLLPGQTFTLTFRVNFNTPGIYPAQGSLFNAAVIPPVEIASFNATLTVNHADNLDEQIAEAPNYVYDPEYVYTGDMTFDAASNTYSMMYWPAEYLDGAPMRDLARYLGALHYQDISTVESLSYKGVIYTWDPNGGLVGSNWKNGDVTLVSVIVADLLGQYPATATVTLADSLYTADVTFVVDVYNTLDDEIESAPGYVYTPAYTYVGTFAFEDATNTYTATYTDVNYNPGALYDLARYLGALHRQNGATVTKVTYKGVDYTWNPAEPLKGSNWEDASGTTLVSVVGADFQNGTIVPGTGFTFTVADGIHTETVTFILVINDTTAPEIVSITAIGADGFADVPAVNRVITVDQGYTVARTEIVLNEDVTVVDGTVVSIGTTPYGTITANGSTLTVTPYPNNEVASLPGSFVLSVPAGSVKDLAGNALVELSATLVVNNVAPAAADDAYTTEEDITLDVAAPGVLANDVDWTPLTVSLVDDVAHGTLTLNANGSFSYKPDLNWHGTDTFTYKASDGELESAVTTVTITVTSVKDDVAAVDDEYETDEDTLLTVPAPGVLGNDGDVDGNHMIATLLTGPSNGTLNLNSDGSFTYMPNADFHGTDTFVYRLVTYPAILGSWTDDATVTIAVNPVLDPPTISSPDIEGPYYTGLLREFNVVLNNPANGDAFTALKASVFVDNIGLEDFSVVQVKHPVSGNWVTLTPIVEGNGLKLDLGPTSSFPLVPGQTFTLTFRVNFNTPGTYPAVGTLYNAAVDPAVAIATFNATMEVLSSEIFDLEDFGLWGQSWPGAMNIGWHYVDSFDLDTIQSIEVGMLDADRKTIVKYTADAEQVAWQRANGYITPTKQSSAPFYVEYNGNPIEEGRDLDWTVIFGEAFAEWNPRWGYVKVNTTTSLEEYEEKEYLGERPDITAPTVSSMVAHGATGFEDVTAVGLTFTVPQGYTVETIEITLSEDVVVADGTVVSQAGVPYGTLTGTGNLLTVTPYAGNEVASLIGTFTFSIPAGSVTDLAGHKLTTLEATLIVVNVAPAAVDDAYTLAEDNVLNIAARGVLANDTDFDPSILTAVLVSEPVNGTLTLNADGSFVYTPKPDFNGSDTFTYKANDGTLDSNVATVTITVTPVNDAPAAQNVDATTPEDTAVDVTLLGTDVDGDTLTYAIVDQPTNGTLTIVGNVVTYTPNANWHGTDTFTYKVNDGTLDSNVATVTITVTPVNDAPAAQNVDATTPEDTAVDVTLVGTDVDSDTLTYTIVDQPANGVLTIVGNVVTYTPNANWHGTDSFTYKVNDGTIDSNLATVTITVTPVNDAPVAQNVDATTPEDTAVDVTLLGTDVDGDTLTYAIVDQPTNGTLTIVGNVVTYTPNANWHGTDTFTYKVNDGTLDSNVATVTITVTPVNDAPVAVDDAYTTNEDTVLTVAAPGVLANDYDVDSDNLTVTVKTNVSHGSLVLNGDGSFVYTPNENWFGTDTFVYNLISYPSVTAEGWTDEATVTITVTPVNDAPVAEDIDVTTPEDTAIDITLIGTDVDGDTLTYEIVSQPTNGTATIVDEVVTYTPNANFNGTDSFTYKVNDGTVDSNIATVTITVTPVNDAPVAQNVDATTPEDTAVDVTLVGTDIDGDTLTYAVVDQPTNGTLTIVGNVATYTPNANWHGTDSFTYKVNDDTLDSNIATVTITVTPVNDAPVAVDDGYSTAYETALTVAAPGVLANDSDVENSPLTAVLVAGPAHGTVTLNANGSFTYTPAAGFSGTDSFTYKANDGELDSNVATVSIVVAASTNNPPVAVNDTYTTAFGVTLTVPVPGVLGNDTDADNDPLTAIKVSDPAHGNLTFNANGSFTYVPNATFSGIDTFTYKANDGENDSNVATVSILVETAVNTPPVAQNQSVTTPEDTVKAITLTATDADGDTLTYWIVGQPQHGTVTLAGNVATYTPDQDYHGPDSFTFKANDGTTDSNLATVSITVTAVNDAPVAVDDEYTTDEGHTLTITAPGVLANDADVDGDALTVVLVETVSNGTLTLNANGSFIYKPNAYFNGTDTFTYRAKDASLTSEIATVTINVTPVNNDVIANDDYYETPFNTAIVKDAAEGVLANDILLDPDEEVSIQILDAPQHGTLNINDDGSFTYTPDPGFFGRDTFRYLLLSVRVNGEWSDDANVVLLVKPFTNIYLPLMFK